MSDTELSPEVENAFEAPKANLSETNTTKPILEMERFSAWGVFFLSVVTFGIYFLYWLITRAQKINTLSTGEKANLTMLYAYAGLYVISTAISFIANPEDTTMAIVSGGISLINLVIYIIGIFSVRRAIRDVINAGGQENVHLGGVLTFFFSAIYFQYKINEAIDNQSS